jgi:hypothetical protein
MRYTDEYTISIPERALHSPATCLCQELRVLELQLFSTTQHPVIQLCPFLSGKTKKKRNI